MVQAVHSLTWQLNDAGMGLLERAGLAALSMTLRAAHGQRKKLEPLQWSDTDLTADSVTLHWTGAARPALTILFEFAWQVRHGVLYLPAVHRDPRLRDHDHLRVATHNGITRTFLQHPRVQPKSELTKRIVRLDEDREIEIAFQPLEAARLKPLNDLKTAGFFNRKQELVDNDVQLSGWVYPGIAGRYGGETAWTGPAKIGVLLMLAPITCLYQQLHGERGTWLFVIPDVTDLQTFNERRLAIRLDPTFTDVASLGDAGMQFLAEFGTKAARRELRASCRVVAMGRVRYYQSQSIRKGVADVTPTPISLERYRILHRVLDSRYVPRKPDDADETSARSGRKPKRKKKAAPRERSAAGWIKVPSGRGRIADNLIEGRSWYADLFEPPTWETAALEKQRKRNPGTSIERLWYQNLAYQGGELMELVNEATMWDSESERLFVEAFWQILAALYRQEAEATQRGGSRKVEERLNDLNEDIRRRLTRAKTRALLRETVADLFAKPVEQYRAPLVRERPDVMWSLINDPYDWKRARDLSLLALASYRSKVKRAAAAGADAAANTNSEIEGDSK